LQAARSLMGLAADLELSFVVVAEGVEDIDDNFLA
jgi:hypothetical protein